jgi:tetratricopeptide (TPR) repeat protein
MARKTPTGNMEALSRFSEGRALFDLYLESGDWNLLLEARGCFDRSVAEDPEFGTARLYRAVSLIELGKRDDAIGDLEALEQSLRQIPTLKRFLRRIPRLEHDVHMQLAQAYAGNGDYDKAEEELTKARKGANGNESRLIDASFASLDTMRYANDEEKLKLAIEKAQAAWRQSSAKNETSLAARFEAKIAEGTAHTLLYMLGKPHWDEAEKAFESARQLRPNSRRALYKMAQLHICRADKETENQQSDYKDARLLVARLLELYPSDEVLRRTEALLRSRTAEQAEVNLSEMESETAAWVKSHQRESIERALSEMAKEKENDLRSSLLRDLVRPPSS